MKEIVGDKTEYAGVAVVKPDSVALEIKPSGTLAYRFLKRLFDLVFSLCVSVVLIMGDEENLTRIPASLMGEGNSLLLRRAFEGAVVEAARRAAANYTLAVPQFYGGRIQLLLPLCLTGDKPELALTIQREDGFYAARTCLTLDMAYNNARLICRPETSWIKR